MSDRLQAIADGASGPRQTGVGGWFAGRARRREYWLWVAPALLVGSALAAGRVGGTALIIGLPVLFAWIRRLHDLGYSGWFAPVINIAVNVSGFAAMGLLSPTAGGLVSLLFYLAAVLALGVLPGQPKVNEFGPPPGRRAARNLGETFS